MTRRSVVNWEDVSGCHEQEARGCDLRPDVQLSVWEGTTVWLHPIYTFTHIRSYIALQPQYIASNTIAA